MKSSNYTDPLDRWWPTLPPDELGPAIYAQFRRYIDEMQRRNRLQRIREADAAYYAEVPTIDFGGEQGEWVLAKVNHFRSLVTGVLAMTTAQRPAFEVSAVSCVTLKLFVSEVAKPNARSSIWPSVRARSASRGNPGLPRRTASKVTLGWRSMSITPRCNALTTWVRVSGSSLCRRGDAIRTLP